MFGAFWVLFISYYPWFAIMCTKKWAKFLYLYSCFQSLCSLYIEKNELLKWALAWAKCNGILYLGLSLDCLTWRLSRICIWCQYLYIRSFAFYFLVGNWFKEQDLIVVSCPYILPWICVLLNVKDCIIYHFMNKATLFRDLDFLSPTLPIENGSCVFLELV